MKYKKSQLFNCFCLQRLLPSYEQVRKVILDIVESNPRITFSDMADLAESELIARQFDGKPLWYITTVKLDLEARGIIERVPKTSPHQLITKLK